MLSEQRFASFISFFLPDAYPLIDWSRPVEFLEQELRAITRKSKRGHRAVDRLVKVWLNDGTESPDALALRYHRTMTRFEEEKEMAHLSTAERIGRQIGREEGRRDLLLDQLTVKFGPLDPQVVARVNGLAPADLERVGRAILSAGTLEDLGISNLHDAKPP